MYIVFRGRVRVQVCNMRGEWLMFSPRKWERMNDEQKAQYSF